MELKTKISAGEGRQDLQITRDFDLPVALLFQAYTDAGIVEQWMGTKVLELENRAHGSYRFETTDPKGNTHGFHGTIHTFVPGSRITRTFEMENAPFDVQLEFLQFEALTEDTSRLTVHTVFRSAMLRDQMLQLPFAQGINMAHNRLQQIMNPGKK